MGLYLLFHFHTPNSQVATTLHYLRNVNHSSNMLDSMEKAFKVSAPNCTKISTQIKSDLIPQ